ncbi:hypothetical protein QCA50_020596 [Cerrena zonata]|uniref:ATPase F1/V1/A1 complex alpha/beta subunit nucleotide-binding domain-containing protein n=1 Tax=Cerrena zonata TaxID=2478898 RepID=A0AAW0F9A5_9APHY
MFHFSRAGSEVSALLGRIPSAIDDQSTPSTDMGGIQERIITTKKVSVSVSVQAIYVPADDLTDSVPARAFAHLDATIMLSRPDSELAPNALRKSNKEVDDNDLSWNDITSAKGKMIEAMKATVWEEGYLHG